MTAGEFEGGITPQIIQARDMVEKLWWEIEGFRDERAFKLWRAFNCAVTTWHLTDWLWKGRKADGCDAAEQLAGGSRVKDLAEKIAAVRERRARCREMLA